MPNCNEELISFLMILLCIFAMFLKLKKSIYKDTKSKYARQCRQNVTAW